MSWALSLPLTTLDNLTTLKLSLLICKIWAKISVLTLQDFRENWLKWASNIYPGPSKHSIHASSCYDYYYYHSISLCRLRILYLSSRPHSWTSNIYIQLSSKLSPNLFHAGLFKDKFYKILVSKWHVELTSQKLKCWWALKTKPAFLFSCSISIYF